MKLEELQIKKREYITVYTGIFPGVAKVFYLIATKEGWKNAAIFELNEGSELDIRTSEVKDEYGNIITTLVIDRTPLRLNFIPINYMQFPEGKFVLKNIMPVPPFSETFGNYIKCIKEV
jgi:hypothetical protein